MKNSANPTLCPTHDNYEQYDPNPSNRKTGDCAIRAVSKALGITWSEAYKALCAEGLLIGMLPHSFRVMLSCLCKKGFLFVSLFHIGASVITVHEFAKMNSCYTFVLLCDNHVVCVKEGKYYDSWDSGEKLVYGFWVKKSTSSGK